MRPAPRVVLDSHVVLSALLFAQGRLAPLRRAWQAGAVLPLVSAATASELIRALAYPKFKLGAEDREELLADYLPHCQVVEIPVPAPLTPPCRDPLDRPFLELALAGRAVALVTGDRDLLSLAGTFDVPILTPEAFLAGLRLLEDRQPRARIAQEELSAAIGAGLATGAGQSAEEVFSRLEAKYRQLAGDSQP